MQLTITSTDDRNVSATFTLMFTGRKYRPSSESPIEYEVDPSTQCPLCSARVPEWFADPASESAMNPDASPVKTGEICNPCLNELLEQGVVEVSAVDPRSF